MEMATTLNYLILFCLVYEIVFLFYRLIVKIGFKFVPHLTHLVLALAFLRTLSLNFKVYPQINFRLGKLERLL